MKEPSQEKLLKPLPWFVPVSALQLRIARVMFELCSPDLYEVMRVYGVNSSAATLWRAQQDSVSRRELQAEMRQVFQELGLVFYENEGVAFHKDKAPPLEVIDRLLLPRPVVEAFKRLRRDIGEPKIETALVKKLDGKPAHKRRSRKRPSLELPPRKIESDKTDEQDV